MNSSTAFKTRLVAIGSDAWRKLNTPQGKSDARLWPWLIAGLLALAWLQPHHYYPIPGFHKEAWVANWFASCLLILAFFRHQRTAWSPLACVFLALAACVWLQVALGMYPNRGQALMISAMLLGGALLIQEAQALQAKDPNLALDVLMMSFGLAGMASVFLLWVQLLQIQTGRSFEWFMWVSSTPDGARPAGNVGQPNQLATLLSFGLVAGLWAMHRQLWGRVVMLVYLAVLATGLGIVQSRSGLIQGAWLVAAALIWSRQLGGRKLWMFLVASLLVQWGVFSMVAEITQAFLDNRTGRDLNALREDAARLTIYQLAWEGVWAKPWLGWGIQEQHELQWYLAGSEHALGIYTTLAHNLPLDIFLWLGIPLGILVMGVMGFIMVRAVRRINSIPAVMSLMCIGVFLVHAMVEFPHWIPSILLPVMAMAGVLMHETTPKSHPKPDGQTSPALRIFLATVVFAVASLSWLDYLRLEENFRTLRAEQNRLIRTAVEPRPTWVMHHLADNMRMSRMFGRLGTSQADLAWMEEVVRAGPSYGVLFTYITSLALAGRSDEAEKWMRRLDAVAPADVRDGARVTWARYQTWYPTQLANLQWPNEPAHFNTQVKK